MEKGKIKIKKNGTAFIDKKIAVPKLFDLSKYTPEAGSVTLDCDYEVDENKVASKIIIDGTEIGEDNVLKKAKDDKEKNKLLKSSKKNNFTNASKSFVPKDTSEILSNQEYIIDNFNLELNKLPRQEGDKFQFYKSGKFSPEFEPKPNFPKALISQIVNNEKSIAKSLFKDDDSSKIINFKPNWRIIVGLGGESVYETSITLHHIYGIPYIPASSIKGVVRSWIINMVFGNPESEIVPQDEKQLSYVNAEYRAFQNESFCYVFGCPAEFDKVIFENGIPKTKRINNKDIRVTKKIKTKLAQLWSEKNKKFTGHIGKVIFLDAFPITEPKIEVDIMNVHYPNYYNDSNGNTAPTDTQNPNPIPFLTVAKTDFQFIIGTKDKNLAYFEIAGKTISDWLKEALSVNGIGAKTAVGYGRFNVV